MDTIVRTRQGTWRPQVRREGKYASSTFRLKTLATEGAVETERLIDMGGAPSSRKAGRAKTIGDLINVHIADLLEGGKPMRRSKRAVLDPLKQELDVIRIYHSIVFD